MVPILSECCGEVCQTARLGGIWRWETFTNFESARTQRLGIIFTNGESYIFDYEYFIEYITIDGGTFYSDSLGGDFEGNVPGGGNWDVGIYRYSGDVYSPDPPEPPLEGSNYELSVSWCPACENGITCTIEFDGVPYQSFTIEDACEPRYDFECDVELACSPQTVIGNDMSTTTDLFVTVTDFGGGLYQLIIDDLNASGLWTDPLAYYSPTYTTPTTPIPNLYSGAGFMCYDCTTDLGYLFSPYRLWHLVDPNDGDAPYTLPIEVSGAGFGAIFGISTGAIGLQAQIDYDFSNPDGECDDLNVLKAQAQALLDAWVTQFGSGNVVQVRNATATSVDCYGYREQQLPGTIMDVANLGVAVNPYFCAEPVPSNVTSFEVECGDLPVSPNIVEWVYNPPT